MAYITGKRRGRPRRFVAVGILVIFLLAALTGFLGFTRAGSAIVLRLAAPLLSSADRSIAISGVGPLLTGDLTVAKISLADKKGPYAEIDGLVIDWSPLDLMGLKFNAATVHADRVRFERMPESSGGANGSSSAGLPVAIDIKSLSVPQITLGPSFSGKEETLAFDGSLSVDRKAVIAGVAIQDLGDSAANAILSLNYDLAAGSLAIDAEASEPKNGIIAGMLNLPGRPALGFKVKGRGPLADWKGTASASVEGLPVAQFNAAVQKSASGSVQLALKGGGAVDAVLPPTVAPLFKGRTDVDIAMSLDPEGTATVQTGHIKTAAVSIELAGTLALSGQNDFHAQLIPLQTGASFAFGTAEGQGSVTLGNASLKVSGVADKAQLSATASLAEISLPQGRIQNLALSATSSSFDLKDRTGLVDMEVSVGGAALKNETMQRLVQAPVRISAPVKVTTGSISAGYILQSGVVSGKGNANYEFASKDARITFDVVAQPSALPPELGKRLTQAASLRGAVKISSGDIALSDLKISSQAVTAEGSASVKAGAIAADISGSLPDLSRLQEKAKGKGQFTLSAGGTIQQPEGKVVLTIPDAVLSGQHLEKFDLKADGKLADGGLAGNVSATGSIGKQPIEVTAVMKQSPGGTDIPEVKIIAGANTVSGAMTLDKDFMPTGRLVFDLADLPLLGAMAGQPLQGAAKGALALQRDAEGQMAAKLDLVAQKFGYDKIAIAGVKASLSYEKTVLNGKVSAAEIASGTEAFKNADLAFKGSGGKTDFALAGNYDGGPVSAMGAVSVDGARTVLHLDQASAVVRKIALKLAEPSDVTIANGAASVQNLTIAAGSGRVIVSGKAGSTLDLRVKIENLPAALANNFSRDLGADGAISGSIKVTGRAGNPFADFSLVWPRASLAAARSAGAPALDISARGQFANQTLDLTAEASGGGLAIKGGGKLQLSGAKTISMRFSGSGPLSLGQPFVAAQGLGLSGTTNFDVSIGGGLTAPSISGTVKLVSAGLDVPRQNLRLTDIVGTIRLDGKTARIEGLAGKFSGGGTFSASGTVGIAPNSGFPADIALKIVNQSYTDGNLVTALVGGDISLKGPLAGGAVIGGQVVVKRAVITVPEKIPASLAAINLEHRNAPQDVLAQAKALKGDEGGHAAGSSALRLALNITARNQIFVRGRGMDAELGGALNVTGTTAAPVISGGFQMIRGRLSILGKRLDFTSGTISFGGGLVPTLNLNATSSSSSLAITINVSGPANDPAFKFTSSPSRPQDEVLAQLVFGRSATSLSPLQIAQLADAVLQLSGGRSSSIFTKLRKGAGIDDLDVTTDSSGNTQVTAGKYLNDKTYLELQQGATAGTGKAIINLDAGKGIKLRGEADSNGGGSAGIFFEKDY